MAAGPSEALQADDVPRRTLCFILQTHGRALCHDPQRCEAFLRDLCIGYRREVFLLIAALRERIVDDLLASLHTVPHEVLISRLTRKLCDNLGLNADPARWAVESWLIAVETMSDAPVAFAASSEEPAPRVVEREPVDPVAPWLVLCGLVIAGSLVAIAAVAYVCFHHDWPSLREWLIDTAVLAAGLGLSGFAEYWAARGLARRNPPGVRSLDPSSSAAALLPEALAIALQPLVPLAIVALWIAEWTGALHWDAPARDLSFHLGRILQTLLIGAYLWKWSGWMLAVQGRLARSLVRAR